VSISKHDGDKAQETADLSRTRLGTSSCTQQALIGHMQKAKMKALSESTFPAGCSPGLQHLPAVFILSLSLTALWRALLQSPERQKDSRPRAALAPALSEAARMGGSFCLPGGGGMEASRPHRCWLLLFSELREVENTLIRVLVLDKGGFRDHSEGLGYFSK